MTEDPALDRVARALREAQSVVVFTGAGVSAESGLPTFRSGDNAMWKQEHIARYANPTGYRKHPREAWSWYCTRARAAASVMPNYAHGAIVEIERRVKNFLLITQNVDGLHHRAGSKNLIELHGNLRQPRCFDCGRKAQWPEEHAEPRCANCGGLMRPDVVMFEEMLPEGVMERARDAASRCDLLISVGTSNLVWPARELPEFAAASGAHVAIVNPELSGQISESPRVTYLPGKAGDMMPALVSAAWPTAP
jgi:NAD-dependent protein deacetylase/lipoamidase